MKQLISRILMLVTFLSVSLSALCYDFEVDGLYYNIISTVDRTVALTYKESVKVNGYYGGYNDYSKEELIIPQEVEYLGQLLNVIGVDIQAFEYNTAIKRLVIPSTIQWLHQECFDECTALEEVVIEDGETPLEFYMKGRSFYFADCPISTLYLGRNIILPSNIGRTPFAQLDRLNEVILSENVTILTQKMFSDCTSLKAIELPKACTEIGTGAFSGCTNLISIENTSQISKLGGGAFLNCTNLKSFQCDDLVSLGGSAFQNCSSISDIELGNSLTVIPENAFDGCESLSLIHIPEETKKISSYAFQNCRKLEKIVFPSKINTVDHYAFNGCESLKSIVIDYNEEPLKLGSLFLWKSDNENNIGVIEHLEVNRNLENTTTFCYLTDVKTVSIGANVTKIESFFELTRASGLESITIFANTPPKTNWYFYNNLLTTVKIKVPKGTKEAYQNSDSWKGFWNIEEMDISTGIDINNNNSDTSIQVKDDTITILNKIDYSVVRIYSLQGQFLKETTNSEIHGLPCGLYIITIDNQSFKIAL